MSRDRKANASMQSSARNNAPRGASRPQQRDENIGRRAPRGQYEDRDGYYVEGGYGEQNSRRPVPPPSPKLRQPPSGAMPSSPRRTQNGAGRSSEMSPRRPVKSKRFRIPPQPASTVDDMDVFFAEISTISDLLKRLKGNVDKIVQLQESMLSMEGYGDGDEQSQMDELAEENKIIMESVKKRAKAIEQENVNLPPSHPSLAMRTTQHGKVKQKFLDFLKMYNETERDFSARVKTQMEKSIRSMNPDLNDDEIKEALDEQMEGGFQSMMMDQSGRYEGASSALAEAQSRQNEMQKIEETIVQLTEMFIEMSTLVEAQGQVITTIEQHVETTEQYTVEANKELDTAIVTAKKVRGRKWQLLLCCFLLLAIGGVLLYLFVIKDLIDQANTPEKSTTTSRAGARTNLASAGTSDRRQNLNTRDLKDRKAKRFAKRHMEESHPIFM